MLFNDFVDVLKIPDVAVITPIMGSREPNDPTITSAKLAAQIPGSVLVDSLEAAAGELWRLGSTLPVVYDLKNPKRAYVEHVVSTAGVAGVVLLCVGMGLLVLAALGVALF